MANQWIFRPPARPVPVKVLQVRMLAIGTIAAVGAANPKGPLGHPLHGPLTGPVS